MINIEEFHPLLEGARRISGIYFRAITADRASKQSVLSTQGSFNTGGRFNIRNEFGALYVSEHCETAIKESINTGRRVGFSEFKPKTLV